MPILTAKTQRLDKVRVDFFNQEFKRLLAQKGLRIQWEQRQHCPCFVSTSEYNFDLRNVDDVFGRETINPTCPFCAGKGVITHSAQEIKAIVSGINSDYDQVEQGTVFLPEILLTLLPEHLPNFGDRFTLLDSSILRTEIIDCSTRVIQGAIQRIPLSYQAVTRTLELEPDNVEKTILSVYYTDDDGNTVGELPEEIGGVPMWSYHEPTNSLQIQRLNNPGENARISVTYYASPSFVCLGQPYALRDTFIRNKGVEIATPMVVQAYAKLEKK